MYKSLIASEIIAFVSIAVLRIVPYFEGIDFDKYWSLPMVVLPINLIALLVFLISSTACAISVFRKNSALKTLFPIALLPLFVVALYLAPFPHYEDGMRETVRNSLSLSELKAFAVDAWAMNPDWNNYNEHDRIVEQLRVKHSKVLSLSPIPPRISVEERYVSVFYGSALVKHWGVVVSNLNEFPIDHIPEEMYRRVYDGVWVYHDIW